MIISMVYVCLWVFVSVCNVYTDGPCLVLTGLIKTSSTASFRGPNNVLLSQTENYEKSLLHISTECDKIGLGSCYLVTSHDPPILKSFSSSPELLFLVFDYKFMYIPHEERCYPQGFLKNRSSVLTLVRSISTYHMVHCYLNKALMSVSIYYKCDLTQKTIPPGEYV